MRGVVRYILVPMDWATRRRRTVFFILGVLLVTVLAIVAITVVYETPTCSDGRQNGDERGTDCGGTCTRICSIDARPVEVSFARALTQSGRTDAIAYLRNPNREYTAQDVEIQLELYGADGLLGSAMTTVSLPPASVVPVFVPKVLDGTYSVRQTFGLVTQTVWEKADRVEESLTVGEVRTESIAGTPRITARITNTTAKVRYDIPVVVTVFDAAGTAIAASQTVLETVPAGGVANAVFTWQEAWSAPAARVEVMPLPLRP
jgi:hypothetical protein